MSERKRMNIRVLPEVMDYIDAYRDQYRITYHGQALGKIIQDHEVWKIEIDPNEPLWIWPPSNSVKCLHQN